VQFYGLDFGGGGIMPIIGLPHTGSVATRMERDRVVRTIEEVMQVMEYREALYAERGIDSFTSYMAARARGEIEDPHGHVFMIVDGWFTMKQDFSDLEQRIGEFANRGLTFGIHLIITASRWSEIRTWLRDLLGTKFELRLGDPMESDVGSRKAATVPNQTGRGITSDGLHFLSGLPRLDGSSTVDDLSEATKSLIEEIRTYWPGRTAPPVRMLPARQPVERLPEPKPEFSVCLGTDEQRLAPVWHDFLATPHLLVLGENESGKTNDLRLILRAIARRYTPEQAKVLIGDPRRDLDQAIDPAYRVGYAITTEDLRGLAAQAHVSMKPRLPGSEIGSDRLRRRDWWDGPELFVVVDDYELLAATMGSALEPLVPMLAQAAHIGLHLIVARNTAGGMRGMMDSALRRMWELGNPALLHSYPKEEGKFLGQAAPRKLPPGRVQLVGRRGIRLVQTGVVAESLAKEDR
jgi:S-DNA-T family DNA segregation ATPase FtsK/SpoIIIE